MCRHSAACGRALLDHQESTNDRGTPPEATGDHDGRESLLDVEPTDGVIDPNELGLDLDDEGRPSLRAQRQDVDRTTLPELGERDLHVHLPAEVHQVSREGADQSRMVLIDDPVHLAATPRDGGEVSGVDGGEDQADRPDGKGVQVAAFDQRHGRLGHAGGSSDVRLTQPSSPPQLTQNPTDATVVHGSRW